MAKVEPKKLENPAALAQLNQIVKSEGFFYAMRYYGFADVNDTKFHELRRAYNKAGDELQEYFVQNLKRF